MLFPRPGPCRRAALAVLGLAALAGCQSYNDRIDAPLRDFERGEFARAAEQFADRQVTGSEFLSGVEAGTAAFVDGDFEGALAHFHAAEERARETEERALIGGESIAEMLTTFFINEGHAAYVGEGYERAMLHAMLGLSYLALGQIESVEVEARRIDDLITSEEELYGSSYGAGGMAHLLSALSYELRGEPGEAYIDYERMYDKGLAPEFVGAALLRLSATLSRDAERQRWTTEFGEHDAVPADWPSIVVIGGLGMGPAKFEERIDIVLSNGIFSWAVPAF
jgi:tetratricopeptide (TPR) repeat protein